MLQGTEINPSLLAGKTVLITGASSGIGQEIALAFSQAGANVAVNYSKNEVGANRTKALVEEEGRKALIYKCDVSQNGQVKAMIDDTIKDFGSIDILINNAGITEPKFFLEIKEEEWDRMIDIHLKGTYNCCYYAVPYMIEKGNGKIINISSVVAKSGAIGAGAHYCAANAGIIGLTKALANQLAQHNINVNSIAPAMIDTEMIRWRSAELLQDHVKMIPLRRTGNLCEISGAALYLASDYANFITGYTMDINGGMYMD